MSGPLISYPDCEPCEAYFRDRNTAVLVRGTMEAAEAQGVPVGVVAQAFIENLHARHLAGQSIQVGTLPRLVVEHVGGCSPLCHGDNHYLVGEPPAPEKRLSLRPAEPGWTEVGYVTEDGVA